MSETLHIGGLRDKREAPEAEFLSGGGVMGARMRAHDWSSTPLGPVEHWPQSLRTSVSLCLNCAFPIVLWWGSDLTIIYNDEYGQCLGPEKEARALGKPGRVVWAEIWPTIEPMLRQVMTTGEPTRSRDLQLILERHGIFEECYFSFSYSPIHDESGGVGGVFCPVIEMTHRVIGERRLRTLRDLGTVAAMSAAHVFRTSADVLAGNPYDFPFALLYEIDERRETARLAASAGITAGDAAAPHVITLADENGAWPHAEAVLGRTVRVDGLAARFGELPTGAWTEAPQTALIEPIAAGRSQPAALLVAAASPRRLFDEECASFFGLVADQIGKKLAEALAYEEERRRAEALAELDRAKTQFFSNVSHEFRTPLTLMLGPMEETLSKPQGETLPENRALIEVAHRNSLRLLKLVNTLLDFSRVEAGRMQAVYQPTDFASLTSDLASNFRSACDRAGLKLVVDCTPICEDVLLDRDMWEKIVLNLLSNAFKFTFDGEIEVKTRAENNFAVLTVRDTGAGVPRDSLQRIFERFHRIEGQKSRSHEGSGIGLALVQELVKLHGGSISAESAPGEGSLFTVKIPLGDAHLPKDRLGAGRALASTAVRAEAYVEEALRWLPESGAPEVGRLQTPDAGVAPRSDSKPARILFADDNADMRAHVRRLLAGRYDVETAADAAAALAAARAQPPDLLLADVMMPGLDGFGLLKEWRDDPALKEIPVIFLSARAGDEAKAEGLDAGADDYLIKPFSARELLARIGANVEISRIRKDSVERLRDEQERLSLATEGAGAGVWDHNFTTNKFVWSERHYEMFGVSPDVLPTFDIWRDSLHPDDLGDALAEFRRAKETKTPFRAVYRIRKADSGEERWIEDAGRYFYDTQGKSFRCAGVVLDITEKKRAEEALRESRHALVNELLATQALQRMSVELLVENEIDALYEKILDAAVAIMGSDFASMQMLYPDRGEAGEMKLLCGRGFSGEALEFWEWVRADSLSACAVALASKRRCVIPDVSDCEFMAGTPEQEAHLDAGFRAVQSTPLLSRSGDLIGMISTHWKRPHQPSARDLNLMDVLARQAADLIERERNVSASRRLAAIVASSDDAIISKTLEGVITSWNRGAETLFGYSAHEAVGKPITILIPRERLGEEPEILARLRRGESIEHYETVRRRKDGGLIDISLTVSPIRDSSGAVVGASKIARDITEKKDAERRQKLLVDELNHRVKNTLATVQSIALLTLQQDQLTTDAIAAFNARLISLSNAHNILTATQWEGAGIEEVVQSALRPYAAAKKRFSIDGPSLRLRPRAVLAMSLALHELATNASKYGALSTGQGRLRIVWTAAGGAFRFSWRESGGPEGKAPTRRGFGSRLIEEGLARDLGGEVALLFEPSGVVCTIAAPLEGVSGGRRAETGTDLNPA